MFWLERTPLWAIGLAILIGLVVAELIGQAARRLVSRVAEPAADDRVGYILTAALALLGLLIAFSFSAASDRYDARRRLVVEEANAFGTTYLRIQALDPTARAALGPLMVQYVHVRRSWLLAGEGDPQLGSLQAATDELQDRMWSIVIAEVRANPTATINPSLLQTTNDMFDLSASQRAAFDGRLPISILRALIVYALISAGIMGYSTPRASRQLVVSVLLYLSLSVAICLILDLDRPRAGTVIIPSAPMDHAIASIDAAEAAASHAPPAH